MQGQELDHVSSMFPNSMEYVHHCEKSAKLICSTSGMNKAPFFRMQAALSCPDVSPFLRVFKDTLDGAQSDLID